MKREKKNKERKIKKKIRKMKKRKEEKNKKNKKKKKKKTVYFLIWKETILIMKSPTATQQTTREKKTKAENQRREIGHTPWVLSSSLIRLFCTAHAFTRAPRCAHSFFRSLARSQTHSLLNPSERGLSL